jgi:hypothetical protein
MTATAPTILFVKKLLADGQACAKCRDIEQRLHADGLMFRVAGILEAREDDPASPGAVLAARLKIGRAPFFVVRHADGGEQVIESYLAFKRWIADADATAGDLRDAVDRHPDLAYI